VRHRAKVDDELGTYLANLLATWEKTWNRALPETAEDEALRNRHSNDAGIEAVIMRRRRRRYRDKVKPSAIETLRKEIREEFEALDGRYFNAPTKAADGSRNRIIQDVVSALSQEWKVKISYSTAEKCLEEYRRFIARSDADLAAFYAQVADPKYLPES